MSLGIRASSTVRRIEWEWDGPRLDVERPGVGSYGADNLTDVETDVAPRRTILKRRSKRQQGERWLLRGLLMVVS